MENRSMFVGLDVHTETIDVSIAVYTTRSSGSLSEAYLLLRARPTISTQSPLGFPVRE